MNEKFRVYLSSPYEASRAGPQWKVDVERAINAVLWKDLPAPPKFLGENTPRVKIVDPCPGNCLEHDLAEEMKEEGNFLGFYGFCANIVESDLAMLRQCQGMVAYLPKGAVTFGTTHEIIYALENNIPIVLVMPEGVQYVSRWLWGILGPNRLFSDVNEAATVLANRMLVANGDEINGEVYYPSWQKASR